MRKEQYDKFFSKTAQRNYKAAHIKISRLSVIDGKLIAADPMVYFDRYAEPFSQEVPTGVYDVEACISDYDGYKCISAVRVCFTDKEPINFKMVLTGNEDPEELAELEKDGFNGFPVDAGLAAIADTAAHKAYNEFLDKWYRENEDGNIYDGYFAEMFKKSYEKMPEYQRECGDFIDFIIPETDIHMPMFATGNGDGYYPVYWGFSEDEQLCCILIAFFDPDSV